jgi:hypothetical protein
MAAEWTRLCRARDLEVERSHVDVRLGDGRSHRVHVEEGGEGYLLSALVARLAVVESVQDLALWAWQRNRATALVGFRFDMQGRLVGETWVCKAGLAADEFQLHVRTLAAECDRFEYLLTGQDVE